MQSLLAKILATLVAYLVAQPVVADTSAIPSVSSLVFGAAGLAVALFLGRSLYLYTSDSKAGREYRRSWNEWYRKRNLVSCAKAACLQGRRIS